MRRGYNILFWAVLVVSVLLNLYLGCDGIATYGERADKTVVDTLVVHDTVRVIEPTVVYERVFMVDTVWMERADREADNLPISVGMDSARLINEASKGDSVRVVVPITQRVYEDSLYRAWVSGYNPRLDSLLLYRKEVYYPIVIETKAKPKVVVSAGVYGGFGAKGADYGLGISVGVPIWWW